MKIWNSLTNQDKLGPVWQSVPSQKPATFWLEDLTTVVAAYSFTKLKAANTVCCEVRGTTTSNVGFDASHRFDETTALTISGSGDGFITSLQDQSGNGYTASQATTNSQPKIIESGAVVRTNGSQPHLRHDLNNDVLKVALPNNQTYYCIASTWSGITHGNFYSAASGDTELPFGVDFFDLLILTDNSEINTIIPKISDRILDGPYDDYFMRMTFRSTVTQTFTSHTEWGDTGALWGGDWLTNLKLPEMQKDQFLTLKLSQPENVRDFIASNDKFKGVLPDKLNLLTNGDNIHFGSNYLTGFFPNLLNTPNTEYLYLSVENLITGDTPLIDGSDFDDLRINDLHKLNGALIHPQNCPRLFYYFVYDCALTRFSSFLFNCPQLIDYRFYENQIEGSIENMLSGSFPELQRIYCYDNLISGNIPDFGNCPKFQQFHAYNNQLTGVNTSFSVPNTMFVFRVENNLLTAAAVNQILVAFDAAGKTSGTINLGGTGNAAPDTTSGGFNGVQAKANLQAKGNWNITTN